MNRERILGPLDSADDDDRSLRPKRMDEMVGQREVYERLMIAVDAARKREEPLGHILFDGPPGLGKTTFATCIPRELQVPIEMATGASLRAPKDLLPYLTNLQENSVLFIDEIHRLNRAVEEVLYPAVEDFRIDVMLGQGPGAQSVSIGLPPFTLIGAYGFVAVPAMALVGFLFLNLELMAMEIEQPFGDDADDLPLEEYCLGIERVCLDFLRRSNFK